MARFAVFEDATSSTYGATGDRPIWQTFDLDPSQLALNTPSGYASVAIDPDMNISNTYISWTGSNWTPSPRLSLWDGSAYRIDVYCLDLAYLGNMDLKQPPLIITNPDGSETFMPDTGNVSEWAFEADGSANVAFGSSSNPLSPLTTLNISVSDVERPYADPELLGVTQQLTTQTHFTFSSRIGCNVFEAGGADGQHLFTIDDLRFKRSTFIFWGLS